MGYYGGFAPYVRVADRKKNAEREAAKLKKKGKVVRPVVITGRMIATTFWGKAWCDNIESYSHCENRLKRGRTYVRNGSVIDLTLTMGEVNALVSGSSVYKVKIKVTSIAADKWKLLVKECAGKIESLVELLQGKLSKNIMEIITRPSQGLFPHAKEIHLSCSCQDGTYMCKHVAATLYGVGARLDETPEDLFVLRNADYATLMAEASQSTLASTSIKEMKTLEGSDLSALFGIEMEDATILPEKKVIKKRLPKSSQKQK